MKDAGITWCPVTFCHAEYKHYGYTWIAKRNKKERENGEPSRLALLDSSCGLEALSLGFTLRRSGLPSVVGFCHLPLGCTLCLRAVPFVFGLYRSSLGVFIVAFATPEWLSSSCRHPSCRSSVIVRVCRLPSSASVVRCPRHLASRGGG